MRALLTIVAILVGIILFPIFVTFFLMAVPFLCCWLCLKALWGETYTPYRRGEAPAEEIRLMQEIHRNLNRMEDRIEALETIVVRPTQRETVYR